MPQVMPEGLIHESRQPKTSVGVQAASKVMGGAGPATCQLCWD